MTTPTDPLYGDQWHFPLMGNIEAIWDEFSGAGVSVGVYDDGVDYNHPDLNDNYDASLHAVDDLGIEIYPLPVGDDAHGTACAGLIGAESNNGIGGTGVASGVTLAGVNIFNSAIYGWVNAADSSGFMDVASQGTNFDISSNSWGSTPAFGANQNIHDATSFAGELHLVNETLSATGRGGLGTVILQAAGNDALDANGSGTNSSRFTITVAAADETGNIQDYSNFGASILVTAPSGSVTTDVSGSAGYEPGDYTLNFGGTSAATPVTAGVAALMLEADTSFSGGELFDTSQLGWRDVQNILAISASETGSGYGNAATGFEVGDWGYNSASNWNGGAMAISGSYGFGMIDAYAAVRMAEVWSLFDVAQTSTNEVTALSNLLTTSTTLIDADPTGVDFSLTVADDIAIEHIEFSLGLTSTFVGDLSITVTTPDGTVIDVYYANFSGGNIDDTWIFGIDNMLGGTSAGTWGINIADNLGGDITTINSMQMEFFGQAIDNNDVYHYTNDFLTLAQQDATRFGLDDTNGGTDDWLNLAATGVAGADASIHLGTGVATAEGPFGPVSLQVLAADSGIEHAVLGDTNDTVIGTAASNSILGMRGDDTIVGGAGVDNLFGGVGNDSLNGGAGSDSLYGEDGDDSIIGLNGNDWIDGGEGNDIISGQGGSDDLDGWFGDDVISGGNGNDQIFGFNGNDSLYGGAGADNIQGENGNDLINGLAGSDDVYGGNGNDVINAGNGNDTVYGDAGFDTLDGGLGFDTMFGGNGNDVLLGNAGGDFMAGDGGFDTLEGQGGNDTLFGGASADILDGGTGNDTLYGGDGADTLTGGLGADTFVFFGSGGADTITDWQNNIDDLAFQGITSMSQFFALASDVGTSVIVNLTGGSVITIEDASLAQFGTEDLLFGFV